jgi:hypothetical protein
MRRLFALTALLLVACASAAQDRSAGAPPAVAPDPGVSPAPAAEPAALTAGAEPTVGEINDRFVAEISARIVGREEEPAEKVFENIRWFEGVPAGRLLRIMNRGYSRALGVACTHCHVETDFASDEKRPKRAAREMAAMHQAINERLNGMENLATEPGQRAVNCTTCHRGAVDPMAEVR